MASRIGWILVSYLSNRFFLTALVIAAIFTAGVASMNVSKQLGYKSNLPPIPRAELRVYSVDSLSEVRRLHLQSKVDAVDLGSLWSSMEIKRQRKPGDATTRPISIGPPPPSFYDILDEFPNLRMVTLGLHDAPGALPHVVKIRGLTYLSLSGGMQDLIPLESLKNLERLDLWVYQPLQGVGALTKLPHLKTVVVANEDALNGEVLEQLAKLPNLKTLGVRMGRGDGKITESDWAQLAASRSLETMYVGGNDLPAELDPFVQATRALPDLDVQPSVVRPRTPLFVCFAPALVMAAVGYLLASQCRVAAQRLAPHFAMAQTMVAAGWCVVPILAITALSVTTGNTIVFSLSLATGVVAIGFVAGVESFVQRTLGPLTGGQRWESQLQGVAIVALVAYVILPPVWFSPLQPAMPIAFLAMGAWCVFRGLRLLQQLPSLSGAAAEQRPPELGGFQIRPSFGFATARREQRIESLAWNSANRSRWADIQRWRLGNPPLQMIRRAIVVFLGAAVFLAFSIVQVNGQTEVPNARIGVLLIFLVLLACGQVALVWRKRVLSLDVESLRPTSSNTLRHELAVALAADLVIPSLIIAALASVAIHLPAQLYSDWSGIELRQFASSSIPWEFAWLAIVIWTVSLAGCGMAIVVERAWLRLVLAVVAMLLMIVATVGVAALHDDLPRYSVGFPRVLLPYLWVPVALSGAAMIWLWRLWSRLEFDRQR